MIRVVNTRTGCQGEYCGRPNPRKGLVGSPLANPFPMRKESERDAVCDQYQAWFDERVAEQDPEVLGELRRLYRRWKQDGELSLVCWCAPKRCHCDTIKEFLLKTEE